jgi:hypothetical protein
MSLMTQTRRRRAARVLAAAAVLAALPAASAHASTNQRSIIQDDRHLLLMGSAVQAQYLNDAQALGADIVRANVAWAKFAPKPRSKKRPKHFNGANPKAYGKRLAILDSLVSAAQARGLQVLLTPTGPGPKWASRCAHKTSTCKPSSTEFGRFVRALGKRYRSVKLWSIWNEPNLKAWLSPQYTARGSHPVLESAVLYRSLARSAIAALRATGHKRHTILLGETAPVGLDPAVCNLRPSRSRPGCIKSRPSSRPEDFLRALFCLKSNGHSLTGSARRDEHCTGHYSKFRVSGFAHHPYTSGAAQPPLSRPSAHNITIAVTSRLTRLLDQAGRRGRIPSKLPIYFTENGWQTNPPDRTFGVSFAQQAAYMNQSDWISYRNRRVRSVSQYEIVDDPLNAAFQTGVRLADGAPKPSYDAYRLPIWVSGKGSKAKVYGQVRPAADSTPQTVEIQHAAGAGSAFQTVQTVTVSSKKGQFTQLVPNQGGLWRLRWNGIVSREAEVAPR